MTDQSVPPPASVARRNPLQWFAQGGWYFFVSVLSLSMLSPVPFAHAATRLRNPLHWLTPLVYLAAVVTWFAIPGREIAWLPLAIILTSLVHLTWLRRKVWPPIDARPAPRPVAPTGTDPAVAAVLAARARRAEARRIAADDPLLARDLKIGRPDLQRDYDDGGLVDLNSAPAGAIGAVCGLDPAMTERIVQARAAAGVPFAQVDDVFAYTDIPVELWDRIRDRAVAIHA